MPTVRLWLVTATLLSPLPVLGVIWMPEIEHYYVATPMLSADLVSASRHAPSDAVLQGLDESSLILDFDYTRDAVQAVRLADEILAGTLALPGFPAVAITPSFSPDDLSKGSPTFALHVASLIVPDILLTAHEQTGARHYFDAAREYVSQFSRFESQSWLPVGFLWNDHAIAARTFVLSHFWRKYRSHSSYDAQQARSVLQAVARSAELLAKLGHFTFATNHGVMQNLALLHLRVAFPELPELGRYQQLAIARLTDQMKFYVSTEGVVLEHSAAYHEIGLMLLSETFRRMRMLNLTVPSEWREKYSRAVEFLTQIKRPDGTLPRFGNTTGAATDALRLTSFTSQGEAGDFTTREDPVRPRSRSIMPASGYAVWWDGLDNWPQPRGLRQTVLAWSHFPGHGHKHADEMSVLLWADGQDWWTNMGYWPYGDVLYEQAQSWPGSNAPHLLNEPKVSNRDTEVRYQGSSDDIAFLELRRTGPDGYRATRQITRLMGDTWVVIDEVYDPIGRPSQVTWTANPDVTVRQVGSNNEYRLTGSQADAMLDLTILGSDDITIDQVKGSLNPFAGWVAEFNEINEAPAFVIETPAKAWTASVWKLLPEATPLNAGVSATMTRWRDSSQWRMTLRLPEGRISVRRDQDKLVLDNAASGRQVLALEHGANVQQQVAALRRHFAHAASKYGTFRDLQHYREKVSYALLVLLVLQESLLLAVRRLLCNFHSLHSALRVLALVMWGGLSIWLPMVYFSV